MYLKMSGEEAKKIIKKSGKSLTEIASKMGESPQNLNSMLKSSDIKTNVLSRIAKAMDVSIVFFFKKTLYHSLLLKVFRLLLLYYRMCRCRYII